MAAINNVFSGAIATTRDADCTKLTERKKSTTAAVLYKVRTTCSLQLHAIVRCTRLLVVTRTVPSVSMSGQDSKVVHALVPFLLPLRHSSWVLSIGHSFMPQALTKLPVLVQSRQRL